MPRRRTTEDPPTTAVVASATRYSGSAARIYRPSQDWQAECYRHYSICGEARFAAKFFGNACSRAVLSAATLKNGTSHIEDSGPNYDALTDLFDGQDGQTQMLEAMGMHLTIAGECYLIGRTETDGTEVWEVVSPLEVQVTGTNWQVTYSDGRQAITLTEEDVVIRIWLPMPSKRIEADSPFRALLPILSEIEWMTRHIFAQITSRLAGSGILLLPQSMTFPPPPPQDGVQTETPNEATAFMLTLADAMLTPIQDPGSPSAVVPIVVTAPDDAIDKAKLLTFWSELDAASLELRNEAIRRFALGMDLPPEQVLGMSSNGGTGGGTSNGVSHWGAWQVEESTIKMHVEPMLDVIVNALTMGYLRPMTDDPTGIIVYDTSALRLRPDRSKEAFELWDRGLITDEALRRENGFSEDDAPTPEEFTRWLLVKVATGSSTPEQVGAALGMLGADLGVSANPTAVREAPQPPSLEEHPTRPRTPAESSALIAAADALVYRALERAGNRLRQGVAKPPGVPSYETHLFVKPALTDRLLDDAWSCAPQVLAGIADPESIVPVLNSYVCSLLAEQSPHERNRMVQWLRLTEEVSA